MKMNFLTRREHNVLPLEISVVERFMGIVFGCSKLTKPCTCVGNNVKFAVSYLAIEVVFITSEMVTVKGREWKLEE
jgi:hypothetical protein